MVTNNAKHCCQSEFTLLVLINFTKISLYLIIRKNSIQLIFYNTTTHSPVNNIPMYSYRLSVIIYRLLVLVSHCFIKFGFPLNGYGGALLWLWRSIIVIIHSISVQAVVWEGSCTLREWFIQVSLCSVGLNFYSLPQEQIRGFVNTKNMDTSTMSTSDAVNWWLNIFIDMDHYIFIRRWIMAP